MQQIEFIRATSNVTFVYNATPGAIPACDIAVNPDLIYRRVYADVRQPNSNDRHVTFALTFLRNSVSVGTVTQRVGPDNIGLTGNASWWGLTGSFMGATPPPYRNVPHSLLSLERTPESGEYMREVAPLEFAGQFDTVRLTISEWTPSATGTNSGRIVLACLSTLHRW